MSRCARTPLIFLLIFATAQVSAKIMREDIGELKIHDLLVRPTFTLQEPQKGSFSMGESSFALRWELEESYAGVIRIGPRSLLNPLARYDDTVTDDVTLVEAFAQYTDAYGRFRFGRIPIEFGHEGSLWERYLIFPRTLLFQRRAMMLRDVGGSYEIEHNNWFTGLAVHNGESDSDVDGRTWYTARWGYRREGFTGGLVGQTGSTKPIATSATTDKLAGVDPSREAKWRVGGLFVNIQKRYWEWVIEYYGGEREQGAQGAEVGKFSAGHLDQSYHWSKTFSTHLRFDHFDPNHKIDRDGERQISLALVLSNKTRSSNLILVATKAFEDGGQIANDQIRLIWNLSPSSIVRF